MCMFTDQSRQFVSLECNEKEKDRERKTKKTYAFVLIYIIQSSNDENAHEREKRNRSHSCSVTLKTHIYSSVTNTIAQRKKTNNRNKKEINRLSHDQRCKEKRKKRKQMCEIPISTLRMIS